MDKAAAEVEIISKEMIKPSSPTPYHLRNYKLSILDQIIPAAYAPIVLYYHPVPHAFLDLRIALLKKSLSEILTRFFPLAGTIKDDNAASIDCDDNGACFITCCVTNIQASVFRCGGVAIGLCISHKILDGSALATFLKAWAAAAAATCDPCFPKQKNGHNSSSAGFCVSSSLFKANNHLHWIKQAESMLPMWSCLFKKGHFVTQRFVFDQSAIMALKEMAMATGRHVHVSRVETVTGFIWKCSMAASEKRFGSRKPSCLTHSVNLRTRSSPNDLHQNSVGNLLWMASANLTAEMGQNAGLPFLVDEVRKSISEIDRDFVKKLQGEQGPISLWSRLKEVESFESNKTDYYGFSSWCKFGFYDADFGWGRPVWVSHIDSGGSINFMNLTILMDTSCGNGIEAWMTLEEEEMALLEADHEFRMFASINPNPMQFIS